MHEEEDRGVSRRGSFNTAGSRRGSFNLTGSRHGHGGEWKDEESANEVGGGVGRDGRGKVGAWVGRRVGVSVGVVPWYRAPCVLFRFRFRLCGVVCRCPRARLDGRADGHNGRPIEQHETV